jgi:hypothetical protein
LFLFLAGKAANSVLALTSILDLIVSLPAVWLLLAVAIAVFWVFQFVQLMLLSDEDFPGRYDKPLWVAAFILVSFVAPFAFIFGIEGPCRNVALIEGHRFGTIRTDKRLGGITFWGASDWLLRHPSPGCTGVCTLV